MNYCSLILNASPTLLCPAGLQSEGLYRISGFSELIEDVKLAFDRGTLHLNRLLCKNQEFLPLTETFWPVSELQLAVHSEQWRAAPWVETTAIITIIMNKHCSN